MITSYGNKLDRVMGKAFADSYVKLKPKDIVEQVNLDPTVTGIDVVVTYSAALKGITQEIRNIKKAFSGKHPDIKLIILADDGKTDVIAKGENVFYENISRNFDAEDVKYAVEKVISSISTEESETYSAEEEFESDMGDVFLADTETVDDSPGYYDEEEKEEPSFGEILNEFDEENEDDDVKEYQFASRDKENSTKENPPVKGNPFAPKGKDGLGSDEEFYGGTYNESTSYETKAAEDIKTDF